MRLPNLAPEALAAPDPRQLDRWMRMVTIPNRSSVPKTRQEFDGHGRMKPSPHYDRVVDVMEELVKFTLLVRNRSDYLRSRCSERKGNLAAYALAHASGAVEGPASAPGATDAPAPHPMRVTSR